jgi:hypothetical protein
MNEILPNPLLEEAEQAAKEMACEWIRKTLHEVFLQALQQTWKVRRGADSSTMRVELNTDDYADCHDFVNQVALAWREKLQQSKHEQVALWVDQVLESSRDSLWTKPQQGTTRRSPSIPARASQPTVDLNNSEDNPEAISETTTPTNQSTNKSNDFLQIPYTKLRALGQKQRLGSEYLPPEQAIELVQKMGRSGQTYWPLDWNLIDQTAAKIPKKLYSENKKISTNDYQVIPKSLWEKQQQQLRQEETTEPDDSNESSQNESSASQAASLVIDDSSKAVEWSRSGALTLMLDRKRRILVKDTSKKEIRGGVKRAKVKLQEEISRLPSDFGGRRYHPMEITAELSYKERKYLEEYIHKEEDSTPHIDPPQVVFGALKKVGHLHHSRQLEYDNQLQNYRGDEALTDRQVRMRLRKGIKERLGFHQLEKNHDPRTYKSKVLRTCDRRDETQKHLDLDLGNCVVELPVGDKKRLFAFSSLEVKLRDEDATSIHGEDNTDTATMTEEGEVLAITI